MTRSGQDLLRQCFPSWRAAAVAALVCVAVPSLLVALQIHDNPKFSPVDEAAHWDYVKRVAGGDIPRLGQRLEASTRREIVCRGTDLRGLVLPPCRASQLPAQRFPGNAEQYEAQQPPTYYALTVPLRWTGTDVLGVADVTATRATGIFWLAAGLLVLWAACRVMDLGVSATGAGILVLGTAPVVVYHSAVISNDAASIGAGSLVALVAAIAWRRPGRWSALIVGITGALVVAIKTTNLLPVGIVSALLLLCAATDRTAGARPNWRANLGSTGRRWLREGGPLLLGGLVAATTWIVLQRSLALVDPKRLASFGVLRTHAVSSALILREAVSLLSPTRDAFVSPGTLGTNLQVVLAELVGYLLITAALAGLFVAGRRWSHWLGLISVPSLLVGGYLFGLGLRTNYGTDPSLSGRYALAAAPLLVIVLVAGVRGRWVIGGLWVLGAASFAVTLAAMA